MAKKKKRRETTRNSQKRLIGKTTRSSRLAEFKMLLRNREYQKLLVGLEQVDPSDAKGEYANLKALCRLELGEHDKALEAIELALAVDPDNPGFIFTHALCLEKNNQFSKALGIYKEIIEKNPNQGHAYRRMAGVLAKMGRLDFAIVCIKKLLAMGGDKSSCYIMLGSYYHLLGDLDKAIGYYEQALELGKDLHKIWGGIASIFKSKGDKEMAKSAYQQAIAAAPKKYAMYYELAKLGGLSAGEKEKILGALNSDLQTESLNVKDLRYLHFTLAEMYHHLKDYDRAFKHFESANQYRIKCLGEPFDIEKFNNQVSFLKETISGDFFVRKRGDQSFSQFPVFVVGMPRSGTTLLEQIIASHPSGGGAGELGTIQQLALTLYPPNDEKGFLEKTHRLEPQAIDRMAAVYLEHLHRMGGPAERIVDKMPHNFLYLWMVALLFPKTPVIHCLRDPRDTCLSCYMLDFTLAHTYKQDLYTLGRYYALYEELMAHWETVIPNPILAVKYEDMVNRPEAEARKVITHIGLEWMPECLEFRNREHFSLTASNLQIRDGIYQSSVQRWKPYEKYLGPLLKGLAGE